MISQFDKYIPHLMDNYRYLGVDNMRGGFIRPLNHPFKYIHYYYPIKDLAEQVYAETAMIGKHRYDANGNNLLDRYALSADEYLTFMELCNNAANAVYEKLIGNSTDSAMCFQVNEGHDELVLIENRGKRITINSITMSDMVFKVQLTSVNESHRMDVIHKLMVISMVDLETATKYVDDANSGQVVDIVVDINEDNANDIVAELSMLDATCNTYQYENDEVCQLRVGVTLDQSLEESDEFYMPITYKYKVTNFMREEEEREGEILYERPMREGDGTQFDLFVVLPTPLDKTSADMPGAEPERFVSLIDYNYDLSIRDAEPQVLHEGRYIRYKYLDGKEKLFVASKRPPIPPMPLPDMIWAMRRPPFFRLFQLPPMPKEEIQVKKWTPLNTNDDINDKALFTYMPVDFTHSVHYLTKKYEYTRENSIPLIDNAILLCLKYHIIYNWLLIAAPDSTVDLEAYQAKYDNKLIDLKLYIGMTESINIVAHPY